MKDEEIDFSGLLGKKKPQIKSVEDSKKSVKKKLDKKSDSKIESDSGSTETAKDFSEIKKRVQEALNQSPESAELKESPLKKIKDSVKEAKKSKQNESFESRILSSSPQNEVGSLEIKRVPSGIFGMDELIEGGFEQGSTCMVAGGSGTGKTIFAMQFLYEGAVQYHEPGILITFEENRQSLYKHSKIFGWDFTSLEKKGLFKILEFKPHEVNKLMQEGGGVIRDAIKSLGAKRLAIDSITAYSLLFKDEYQKRESILEFFDLLHKWGCTTLIISEMNAAEASEKEGSTGFLTDGIISLYYRKAEGKDIRVHSLEIIKMRGTKHSNKVLAIAFEKDGVHVYADVEVF